MTAFPSSRHVMRPRDQLGRSCKNVRTRAIDPRAAAICVG
jgi:hypothetical protein